MRLRQIEIFYHVYKEGSISAAARALHVSQPSVSKVLRYAEDQLGFDLFKRTKGRLFPTPAADELFLDIKDIYDRIGAFDRSAKNIKNRKGGHIRIGALPSLSLTIIPKAVARLRALHPETSFEITTAHSDDLGSALLEKKCDLCLGFSELNDERFVSQHIHDIELMLIAQKGQLPGGTDGVDLRTLHESDFIGMKDSGPAGATLGKRLNEARAIPNEVVTAHTYYVAASLVRLGAGLSVVDQFTANSIMADGLDQFPFSPPIALPVYGTRLTDAQNSHLIAICLDVIIAVIHEQ
jgi:DNA-binding transcriptional LysR family regulator